MGLTPILQHVAHLKQMKKQTNYNAQMISSMERSYRAEVLNIWLKLKNKIVDKMS